jgi:hypothetical protein
MKSKLKAFADAERPQQIKYNIYSGSNAYGPNHKNALSDGDEKGRGLFNGSIGTRTDILTRNANMGSNIFNKNNVYRVDD